MAYIKNTWVDQEGQVRYTETTDGDYKIFTANYEEVTELGTPVNADNMNHIEDGIEELDATKASISLNNLSSAGQAIIDGKANVNLVNATPTSAFATAMDNANIRTVVQTYVNGTSWYRVYSDKWCEQGGRATNEGGNTATITFLKPFINTNYSVTLGTIYNIGAQNMSWAALRSGTVTASGFSMYLYATAANETAIWEARGYIN